MAVADRSPIEWMNAARCRAMDPSEFNLPPYVKGMTRHEMKVKLWHYAGNLCLGCPVIAPCAADALDQEDTAIIRAGVPIPPPGQSMRVARQALDAIAQGAALPEVTARATACHAPRGVTE